MGIAEYIKEMNHSNYTGEFYGDMTSHAQQSAAVIVPMLVEIVKPRSVADVGCGEGAWLEEFCRHGVCDIAGFDLPEVDRSSLRIPVKSFFPTDFRNKLFAKRRFDLVLSLEVAEHLPAVNARTFVQSLVELGDVVVFSAAIPGQGGTLHLNEQWPQYWADLFSEVGYEPLDLLRGALWSHPKVSFWYAQNMFLAINRKVLLRDSYAGHHGPRGSILPFVHPQLFKWRAGCLIEDLKPELYSGRKVLRFCLQVWRYAAFRRWGRL